MELLQEMLPTTLDMENAKRMQKEFFFQNSTKDRMTHFNTSITVKRRRDNK